MTAAVSTPRVSHNIISVCSAAAHDSSDDTAEDMNDKTVNVNSNTKFMKLSKNDLSECLHLECLTKVG